MVSKFYREVQRCVPHRVCYVDQCSMSQSQLDYGLATVLGTDNQQCVTSLVFRVRVHSMFKNCSEFLDMAMSRQGEDVNRCYVDRKVILLLHILREVPLAGTPNVIFLCLFLLATGICGVTSAGI